MYLIRTLFFDYHVSTFPWKMSFNPSTDSSIQFSLKEEKMMKKTLRKMTSFVLAAVLVLFSLPSSAFAVKLMQPSVTYQTHVQDNGWMPQVADGQTSGTTGLSLRVEAIKIDLNNAPADANIKYSVHVQNNGWMNTVMNDAAAGTTARSLRMEAIRITLENMAGYTVEYRVHVQDIGWMDWVSNGQTAGTTARSLRLEAIQIRLVPAAVSSVTSADVALSAGSVIFGYTFTAESGSVTYAQAQGAPYYLNIDESTVTLTDGTNTSVAYLKDLGISDSGTVEYADLAVVQSMFPNLIFIPSQIQLHLVGATDVNFGMDEWTKDVTVTLTADEINLLVPVR